MRSMYVKAKVCLLISLESNYILKIPFNISKGSQLRVESSIKCKQNSFPSYEILDSLTNSLKIRCFTPQIPSKFFFVILH